MILDHVSHSQISMWLRCPRQWEFRYVKGLKMPPSGAMIEGGCYHTALEINFRQKIDTYRDLPLDECLDVYADEWERRVSSEEQIDWGGQRAHVLKDEGVTLVTEYMVSTSLFVQPVIVEEAIISEVAGVTFVCVPDMVDSKKTLISHKTSNRKYVQDDVDKDLQGSAEAFVLDRPTALHVHVAVKTKAPKIQIVRSYRTRTDIDWWAELATQVVAQMKTGIAPPNPTGWWCGQRYCGFYDICRGGTARMVTV